MLEVLIVDDEPLARSELNRLLAKEDQVKVTGECANGIEAQKWLKSNQADLIFLDIQMPELDGLALAEQLDASIKFVFCTAFNEHAVDAFALNAFDYILKPINPVRLAEVLAKARKEQPTLETQSHYLPDNHGLLLKSGHDYRVVRLSQVLRFESIGNHVAVYTEDLKAYLHVSLSKVEKRLNPNTFFKASRSDIIRLENISRIEEGSASGSLVAILENSQTIDISRRQAHALRKAFTL